MKTLDEELKHITKVLKFLEEKEDWYKCLYYKRRLKDSDYKVQKYTEGLIDDKKWKESKDKRSGWRKEVTDNENAIKEQEAAYQEVVNKYRKGATSKSLFEQCCKRDNELFDTIKEAFDNNTFFTHHTHTHNNE